MPANKIFVFCLEKKFSRKEKEIKVIAGKTLKYLRLSNVRADFYLAGNEAMKDLNKRFRGKDKAANVLSFPEPEKFIYPPALSSSRAKSKKPRVLGEIYLNLEQKGEFSPEHLIVHGVLHLLEFDHQRKGDRIKMEKLEKEIMLCLTPKP